MRPLCVFARELFICNADCICCSRLAYESVSESLWNRTVISLDDLVMPPKRLELGSLQSIPEGNAQTEQEPQLYYINNHQNQLDTGFQYSEKVFSKDHIGLSTETEWIGPLHPAARFAIQNTEHSIGINASEFVSVFIYLDGGHRTKGTEGTSFAFTVIAERKDRSLVFVGLRAGLVACDSQHRLFVEAQQLSSLSAEPSALVWAQLWALAFFYNIDSNCKPTFSFYYDNMCVGRASFEAEKFKGEVLLTRLTRIWFHALSYLTQVSHSHVPAHDMQPLGRIS